MISFGEGIIAGFFYAIFAVVFLVKLAQEDTSNAVLYVMNGLIITISIALAVGNACQMGLVDQASTRAVKSCCWSFQVVEKTNNIFFSEHCSHLRLVGLLKT